MLWIIKKILTSTIITVATLLPALSQSGQEILLNISQDKPQYIPVASIASELTDTLLLNFSNHPYFQGKQPDRQPQSF